MQKQLAKTTGQSKGRIIADAFINCIAGVRVVKKIGSYESDKVNHIMRGLSQSYCNPLVDYMYILGYDIPTLFYRSTYGAVQFFSWYVKSKVLYHPETLNNNILTYGFMVEREYKYRYGTDIDFMLADGTLCTTLKNQKYEIQNKIYESLEQRGIFREKISPQHLFCENGDALHLPTYIKSLTAQYERNHATSNDVWSDDDILQSKGRL